MTTINKTSEIEYCEKCGTMLITGECRRCNPELTRGNKSGKVTKTCNKNIINNSDKSNTHNFGVDKITEHMLKQGIKSVKTNKRNISMIINNKSVLVRSVSTHSRICLVMGSLDNLIADYLIIITNVKTDARKIHIIPMEIAKKIAINNPCKKNNLNDYFINKLDYEKYENNNCLI